MLTAIVIALSCVIGASVQAQDAKAPGENEPAQVDSLDSELSLRDLMLEEFEKEAKAEAEEDDMSLKDKNKKEDSANDSKDKDEDESDGDNTPGAKSSNDKSPSDKENGDDSKSKPNSRRPSSSVGAMSRLQRPLSEISLATISEMGRDQRPTNAAANLMYAGEPGWVTSAGATLPTYSRQTSRFCHRPLYFEDPNLERCGNGLGCLQNPVSAVRFLGDALTLPCQLIRQCPDREVSSTGDCRCNQSLSN